MKRDEVIAALRDPDPDTGLPRTHAQVAALMGLSRERVRVVAARWLGETGRQQRARIKQIRPRAGQPVRPVKGILSPTVVRRWLRQIGQSYCSTCCRVLPLAEMSADANQPEYRCKPCSAAVARAAYAKRTSRAAPAGEEYEPSIPNLPRPSSAPPRHSRRQDRHRR